METKTIGYSALALVVASLSILGGIELLDDDTYYCEDKGFVMQCDKLSQYYGLDNGKCWNDGPVGNKVCRSGWLEIIKESDPIQLSTFEGDRQGCDKHGCIST